jgi:hypothetical protein
MRKMEDVYIYNVYEEGRNIRREAYPYVFINVTYMHKEER